MNRTIAMLGLAWLASASLANKAKAKRIVVDIADLALFKGTVLEPMPRKMLDTSAVIIPR